MSSRSPRPNEVAISGKAAGLAKAMLDGVFSLARLDGDTAHQLYSTGSTFTVCGVQARGLAAVSWEQLVLNARYRFCRRCWPEQVRALARATGATRATNDEIKNEE